MTRPRCSDCGCFHVGARKCYLVTLIEALGRTSASLTGGERRTFGWLAGMIDGEQAELLGATIARARSESWELGRDMGLGVRIADDHADAMATAMALRALRDAAANYASESDQEFDARALRAALALADVALKEHGL